MRKLPIGIQSFNRLISDGFVYIDKTEYIHQLAQKNTPYFLSRPRRFGKSLLISTLKAYWEGKKELFQGLKIAEIESEDWKRYPVFHFDFNGQNYLERGSLETILDMHLRRWEEEYHISTVGITLGERFQNLLREANHQTGLRSVVLVDEYDKSLLDAIDIPKLQEQNRAVFKGFFSSLKALDEYLQFVFITGVTKFEKVSIFSDLNQLRDISMTEEYAGLCGITEEEIDSYFGMEVEELADKHQLSVAECKEQLRKTYDGYCFHPQGTAVYNPFSLLSAFADKEFGSYWFSTGTPTFLARQIHQTGFDVRKFTDRTLYATEAMLSDYRTDRGDLMPLLYQTGYLTIKGYDPRKRRYTLGFPNEEVAYGMLENLMPEFTPVVSRGTGVDVFTFDDYLEQGNLEGIHGILTALFASIPYTSGETSFEHDFQSVIYILFMLLGQFVQCERHTWQGRIDCVVETKRYVYIFEFKRDGSAQEALDQIEKMGYDKPYAADSRKLFKVGVNFDSTTRMLTDWAAV